MNEEPQIFNRVIFNKPVMSWDKPIEQEILEFTKHMAESMEKVSSKPRETGWFANNRLQEDAQRMADAYRTIQRHIEKEIKIRSELEQAKLNVSKEETSL